MNTKMTKHAGRMKKAMNKGFGEWTNKGNSPHSLSQPSHCLPGVHAEHDDGGAGSMHSGQCSWVNEVWVNMA